ncbi:hypothetical protein [Mesorhizobium sp.]|uniref:hypothetical protein n=1 Tax=Mesorhizobium sp. TaxID=1871066 RepID=UPI0011F916BB|nr:hypothetical protein [Mesorhizobium sp.]TIL38501.1 MAG: hypothetical protein E5Y82_13430 [Mesorhizobium sp.]
MNMAQHADTSGDIRRAADCALGIASALTELNRGPVFEHKRDEKIREVQMWFAEIAKVLGYKVEKSV